MSAPNPMEADYKPPPVSRTTLPICGLHVDVYGLAELPPAAASVSCLWLHHPRMGNKERMMPMAAQSVASWNEHAQAQSSSASAAPTRGLIAVAFDQRNHGTRLISDAANEAWRKGNKTHAQDMFGLIRGMVVDTSLLMDALEGYLFGHGDGPGASADAPARGIDQHIAFGISLGGHSVWQTMFAEPRVSVGVIVIGCPDYISLLSDRARKSKLETYSAADGGATFLRSKDFPPALVDACQKYDPKAFLFGPDAVPSELSEAEQKRLMPLLEQIRGKKFQLLSGGADKLVPYAIGEPFLNFFKSAAAGWWKQGGISVEDNVYEGVGHAFNLDMMKDAVRFVVDAVAEADPGKAASWKI